MFGLSDMNSRLDHKIWQSSQLWQAEAARIHRSQGLATARTKILVIVKAVSILPPRCQQQQAWQKQSKHKR